MKNLILSTIAGLVVFFAVYLVGCFVQLSFDISSWSSTGREMTAIIGSILFGVAFVSCQINLNKQ